MPLERELSRPSAPEAYTSEFMKKPDEVVTPQSINYFDPDAFVEGDQTTIRKPIPRPEKTVQRVNAPLKEAAKPEKWGIFNIINSIFSAASVTPDTFPAAIDEVALKFEKKDTSTAESAWEKIMKMSPDERYEYTAKQISKIDDPFVQTMVAASSAVIDTATFTKNPGSEAGIAALNSSAAKIAYNSLSTALPFARDLLLASATGGMYAIPAIFGTSSAISAYNSAENIRNVSGQEYVHPLIAFGIGLTTTYPFLRYMSAPLQLNIQKSLYNLIGNSLGAISPRVAQVGGAAISNVVENYLANEAAGNLYTLAGAKDVQTNIQLGSWAVLGALMELPQSPHMLGYRPAMERVANKVSEKLGGKEIDKDYVGAIVDNAPAFGGSVVEVNPTRNIIDERINAAEIAMKTMDDLYKDSSAISEEGIRIIDTTAIDDKADAPGVIAAFKKSFKEVQGDIVKDTTPAIIRVMKEMTESGALSEGSVFEAYSRMVRRAKHEDVVDDKSAIDDFSETAAFLAVKKMLDGDKPSVALEEIGVSDPVLLTHVDDIFSKAQGRLRDIGDLEAKYPDIIKEARAIDDILKEIEDAPRLFKTFKSGERIKSRITDNFIREAKRAVGKEKAKEIEERLLKLRDEFEKNNISEFRATTSDRIDEMIRSGATIEEAIEAYDLPSELKRVIRQVENAKIVVTMNRRINEFFADTGYQLPDITKTEDWDGRLTDADANYFAKEYRKVINKIRDYNAEWSRADRHNQNFFSAILRNAVHGDIGRLDRVAQISSADPIGGKIMREAVKALRYAGIMNSHIDAHMEIAINDMIEFSKMTLKTDDLSIAMEKARRILDEINDAEIEARSTGEQLELTTGQSSHGLVVKYPKILEGKFSVDEIMFAQKIGNFNERLYNALQKVNDSLIAINPAKIIREATDFTSVPYDYQYSYFPRYGNSKAQDIFDEWKTYRDQVPADRPFMNRELARKPKSMLSTATETGALYRDKALDEWMQMYAQEWKYAITRGQVDKFLDSYLTHVAGYAKTVVGNNVVYKKRRFWSNDTGILSISNVRRNEETGEYETDNLALRELLLYRKDNESDMELINEELMATKSGRFVRSIGDILGVPANLIAKLFIGLPRGVFYNIGSVLQGVQQSYNYHNVEFAKHPFATALAIAKGEKVNFAYLAKRAAFGIANTLKKSERLRKMFEGIEKAPSSVEFQEAVSKIGFREDDPEFNSAIKEYFQDYVPMFAYANKWEIYGNSIMQRSNKHWEIAKKTGKWSDYIRASAKTAESLTDFLTWTISAADAGSKAMAFDLAWEHFNRTMKRLGWQPKNDSAAFEKKKLLYKELHGDLFSASEFEDVMNYIKIGDYKTARKIYARLFAEVTTPSFTSANRSQVAKRLAGWGILGKTIGMFSEWSFKAIPNQVQILNEARRGNWAPVVVTLLTSLAFYELYDEWNRRQRAPRFARNRLGKDIMSIIGVRNFQDIVSYGIHTGYWIKNQFDKSASDVQKLSFPSLPLMTGTYLESVAGLMYDIVSADTPVERKKALSRIPGYLEFLDMCRGEYTEKKAEEAEKFLDFLIGQFDNIIGGSEDSAEASPTPSSEAKVNISKERKREIKRLLEKAREQIKARKKKKEE